MNHHAAWILAFAVVAVAGPSSAAAQACERPLTELSTWMSVGGGALHRSGTPTEPGVHLAFGADATQPIHGDATLRVGPWIQVETIDFLTMSATGGLELFLDELPDDLNLFQYTGTGVLSVRLGGGWYAWRGLTTGGSPVLGATIAYGYRAPFVLHDSWACECDEESSDEPCRRWGRYMQGVRLYVAGQLTTSGDDRGWQVTGGIEFEPVGSFRYLLGLY